MTIPKPEDKTLCLCPVSFPASVLWWWDGKRGSMVPYHFGRRKLRSPKAYYLTKVTSQSMVFQSISWTTFHQTPNISHVGLGPHL